MNNFLKILGLSCIFAFVAVCSHASTSMPYKITGELITIEPEDEEGDTAQSEDDTETETEEAIPTEDPALEPVDLSDATLTVSYKTTNADGESETVTLYEGPYQENFANVV